MNSAWSTPRSRVFARFSRSMVISRAAASVEEREYQIYSVSYTSRWLHWLLLLTPSIAQSETAR